MSPEPVFTPTKSLRFELGLGPLRADPFGSEIVRRIHEDYGGRLDIFKDQGEGKPFVGSSTFGLFAVDERARSLGARVASPSESELLLALGEIPEPVTYRDLGVVIDFSGNNHEMAVGLLGRLNKEHRDFDMLPAVLTDLVTRIDNSTGYGLNLQPNDTCGYGFEPAKILRTSGGNFDRNDPNLVRIGLPSAVVKEGERMLYTTTNRGKPTESIGLSRLCLYRGLGLDASLGDLAISGSGGRVVLVRSNEAEGQYMRLAEHAANFRDVKGQYLASLSALQHRISAEIAAHQK